MIAVGYIRRSKKSDSKVVSLDAQRDAIVQYCERKGFELRAVLSHDGVSGTKTIRFAEIEKNIVESGAEVMVIYNLDRLARDSRGLQGHFEKIYKRGIRVHETTSGEIPYRKAMDRFIVTVRAAMDQLYAEHIGEKTADALQYKKQERQQYTRVPPLGYVYLAGNMVPEPEEQRALRILAECRASGLGARKAQRALIAAGYQGRMSLGALHRALREGV